MQIRHVCADKTSFTPPDNLLQKSVIISVTSVQQGFSMHEYAEYLKVTSHYYNVISHYVLINMTMHGQLST